MKQIYSCFSNCLIHGFYMVIMTRSTSSGVNMSITAEVREYFENLIKPLVTNQSLGGFLSKFKEGVISKFEGKLREQNLRIQ